jgi:dienelactone hydrolase
VVAEWLESIGVRGFVLRYRFAPHRHPIPLNDAGAALRFVRENAGELGVDPVRVGILGFSAGGHLAGSAAVRYDLMDVPTRPDFAVLIYPVVTMGEGTHAGSRDNLLGPNASAEMIDLMSLERHVTSETPPMFMYHGFNDEPVPVANSLNLATALAEKGVPFDLHIVEDGPHGTGLGTPGAPTDWRPACEAWLNHRHA